MTEHTKGPWTTEDRKYATVILNQHGVRIADVHSFTYQFNSTERPNSDVRRVNAALMAAAPELYDALKEVTEVLRLTYGWTQEDRTYKKSVEALALADKVVAS